MVVFSGCNYLFKFQVVIIFSKKFLNFVSGCGFRHNSVGSYSVFQTSFFKNLQWLLLVFFLKHEFCSNFTIFYDN